jgi:ABC-type transport system involved in multi-copper enzyme maturation permease subunit
MPVYKRSYRSYTGSLTPAWSRFLVVTRYGMADAWRSRVTNGLFIVCQVPVLIAGSVIYLLNSAAARAALSVGRGNFDYLKIDSFYFFRTFQFQCWLALVLTAWVGPRLMAPDLANNGLSLLLSHPLSRREYILGKLAVLGTLLSGVTWVPSLILFFLQAQLASQWAAQNWFIAGGLVLGSLLWIVLLSLLVFAVSVWVKWRMISTGLVFGVILVPAGLGQMVNAIVGTRWGSVLNIPRLATTVWGSLLRIPHLPRHRHMDFDVSPTVALCSLAVIAAICLWALHTRVRGREVVRG